MTSADPRTCREAEMWRALAEVDDPELDEPITEMGFVERAAILADGAVEVDFRLPTYWCSPNFAYLMLDGVRTALESLSWRPAYRINLLDHMFAEDVNRGVAAGKSFGQIFGEMTEDCDLDALRANFRAKAFKRRQEAALLDLRASGMTDAEIVDMRLADFDALTEGHAEAAARRTRYRKALTQRLPDIKESDRIFVTWEGAPITLATLTAYLTNLRSIRINMEFNGALCRGLQRTRYKQAQLVDGEPTLVDFILDRVPPAVSTVNS